MKDNMVIATIIGGLGNQLYGYAMCRMVQHKYGQRAYAFALDYVVPILDLKKFNVSDSVAFICQPAVGSRLQRNPLLKKYPFSYSIKMLIDKWYYRVYESKGRFKEGKQKLTRLQPVLNFFGFYIGKHGFVPMKYPRTIFRNKFTSGFFPSHHYFDDIRPLLLEEITLKNAPNRANCEMTDTIENTACPVCVHIRRGDYMKYDSMYGGICTVEYYQKAIEHVEEHFPEATYYVFSDGLDWVKENIHFPNGKVCYVGINSGSDAAEELILMTKCKHFIIANSTFSWWAQYLCQNPTKMVCAPPRFLNDDSIAFDMYMDDWVIIK